MALDETQIAAEVAKRIPKPEPHQEAPVVEGEPPETGYVSSLDSGQFNNLLVDYFNVVGTDQYNEDVKSAIRSIQNWAYETTGSQDHEKALYAIRSLENELGAMFKPDRLPRLARFIKLKQQSRVIDMQINAVKEAV